MVRRSKATINRLDLFSESAKNEKLKRNQAMSLARQRLIDTLAVLSAGLILAGALGCTKAGPRTHPVAGRVALAGGDVGVLAGHTIEVSLRSNPQIRAAGEIQPDGSFTLQMVQASALREGAAAGEYQARIVLADDDLARRSAAAQALHQRFLQFEKSGLALKVPSEGAVTLTVTRR
jgi:hypothetical protein